MLDWDTNKSSQPWLSSSLKRGTPLLMAPADVEKVVLVYPDFHALARKGLSLS